jgi:hypothetical protein
VGLGGGPRDIAAGLFVALWLLGPAIVSGLFLAGIAFAWPSGHSAAPRRGTRKFPTVLRAASVPACLLVFGSFALQAVSSYASLPDWRNDPVFARASQGRGLLLTASTLRAVQLQTRRGVVLEGSALNQLPYVPDSGPEMNRILNVVYGEDLLAPRPFNWVRTGGLKRHCGRELWEQRSPDEWRRLAREFGFSDIVTYAGWSLKLPVAARSEKLTLYHVPDSEQAISLKSDGARY